LILWNFWGLSNSFAPDLQERGVQGWGKEHIVRVYPHFSSLFLVPYEICKCFKLFTSGNCDNTTM